jgi:hypothetical protein
MVYMLGAFCFYILFCNSSICYSGDMFQKRLLALEINFRIVVQRMIYLLVPIIIVLVVWAIGFNLNDKGE